MTRRDCLSLAVAGAALLPLRAAPPHDPKAKEVVLNALEALGGKKFLSLSTREEHGRASSFYRDRLTGYSDAKIYAKYLPPTTKGFPLLERTYYGKKVEYSVLFDGADLTELSFRGARPLPQSRVERYRRSLNANLLLLLRFRLNDPTLQLRYLGGDVIVNTAVHKVELYFDSDQLRLEAAFHRDTGLPVRSTYSWRSPKREVMDESHNFDKYRSVAGIQWPFSFVRERNGDKDFEFFSDEVKLNEPIPESELSIPENTPRLKREFEAP